MIYFALVSRKSDGLALAVNSDSPPMALHPGLEDAHRKLKLLSRVTSQFPETGSLFCDPYVIHFSTFADLSFLTLCDVTYPQVLAFSFLQDLHKGFSGFFDKQKVMAVQRPYALIDFDHPVQKLKQRYNNPQSLSTSVDLTKLNDQLRIHPPYVLCDEELRPGFGQQAKQQSNIKSTIASTYMRYLPMHMLGMVSLVLCCFCAVNNFSRGVHIISDTHGHIDESFDSDHYQTSATFIVCCFLSLYQVYLICYPLRHRRSMACATLGSICVCQLYLYEHRSVFGLTFHVTVACYGTFVIMTRKLQGKLPQYTL